ncbi:unnamed protein product, partial [Allacma fusca]
QTQDVEENSDEECSDSAKLHTNMSKLWHQIPKIIKEIQDSIPSKRKVKAKDRIIRPKDRCKPGSSEGSWVYCTSCRT